MPGRKIEGLFTHERHGCDASRTNQGDKSRVEREKSCILALKVYKELREGKNDICATGFSCEHNFGGSDRFVESSLGRIKEGEIQNEEVKNLRREGALRSKSIV